MLERSQVVELSKRFFGFQPTGRVLVQDAPDAVRQLLRESRPASALSGSRAYDYVLHDVFTGMPI